MYKHKIVIPAIFFIASFLFLFFSVSETEFVSSNLFAASRESKDEFIAIEPASNIENAPFYDKYLYAQTKGVCDEVVIDDSTETCFFAAEDDWEYQSNGYLSSSLYAEYNNPWGAGWTTNNITGEDIEVFVTIPTLGIDEDLEPNATYSVLHADEARTDLLCKGRLPNDQ